MRRALGQGRVVTICTPSCCNPFRSAPCFLGRRDEKVSRHQEACAQPLNHGHAQLLLAPQDFADAAWCSEEWDHVCSGESVLIHEVPDQLCRARRASRPLALFVGGDQTRLCLKPSDISRIRRIPQPINEGSGPRKLGIAVDQDQGRFHHTVSTSILSYSAWLPKNRIAR